MTPERIARFLLGSTSSPDVREAFSAKIDQFFSSFPDLATYRQRMHSSLLKHGFVESIFGNKRWRTSQGVLTQKEMRWAVNQPIQATASLIFKEALVRLSLRFGKDAILLPMHDAVLMQLPIPDWEAAVDEAKGIMLECYTSRCPSLNPRVTVGGFAAS